MWKSRIQALGLSFTDIFNTRDDDAKGRIVYLSCVLFSAARFPRLACLVSSSSAGYCAILWCRTFLCNTLAFCELEEDEPALLKGAVS